MLRRENRHLKNSIVFCNKLSFVLAFLLEHFLSKVHFRLLHAGELCRELEQRVIESFPPKTKNTSSGTSLSYVSQRRAIIE